MTQAPKTVTDERDISSRARTPLRGKSRCHAVTAERDVTGGGRDSDTPPLALRGVTITPGTAAERSRDHAAQLAADPRFASIRAGLALDPFADPQPDLAAIRRQEERTELMRTTKLALIKRAAAAAGVPVEDLIGAVEFVLAHPPLQRPLGTGEAA